MPNSTSKDFGMKTGGSKKAVHPTIHPTTGFLWLKAYSGLSGHSNESLQELKENTEFNIVDKRPWLANMAFLKMATLDFAVSMYPGQGLYAEDFFSVLNRLQRL